MGRHVSPWARVGRDGGAGNAARETNRVEGRDALAGDEISEGGASRRGGTGITSAIDGGDGGGDTGVELREIGGKSDHCD